MTVNRSQLLNKFGELNDLTRKQADELLTSLVEIITASVATGEDVAISGFAKFRRIDRPARLARNPATGETVKVKAKRVARITPLKSFKDSVLTGKAPKPVSRTPVAPKVPAVKATAAKAPAKKAAAKKTAARKPAKKAPAKKGAAKKTTARKTTAKRR